MNYAFISSFLVARFQQPTVSLCYSPKIAKLKSLKSHFLVWPENHHAGFSLQKKKKKADERAGAVHGCVVLSWTLCRSESTKIWRQAQEHVQGSPKCKTKTNTQILLFISHSWHQIKTQKGQLQSRPISLLYHTAHKA